MKIIAVVAFVLSLVMILPYGEANAQVNDLWIGDTELVAHFGGKSFAVSPDFDGDTGQIVLITGADSVDDHSKYWHAWAPATDAYKFAWINELLEKGCVDNKGCGSVRLFWVTTTGIKEEVYTGPIDTSTRMSVKTETVGNHVEFLIDWGGAKLWQHSIKFGDGSESVFGFDGPEGKIVVEHDYPYTGGTFKADVTIQTDNGPVVYHLTLNIP